MKADLNYIKKELLKLADVDYLKAELNRLTAEIKKFDVNIKLTPQAKSRLKTLEKRFNEIIKKLQTVQKQMDSEVGKVVVILRKTRADAEKRLQNLGFGKGGKKTRRKTSGKKTSRKKATA